MHARVAHRVEVRGTLSPWVMIRELVEDDVMHKNQWDEKPPHGDLHRHDATIAKPDKAYRARRKSLGSRLLENRDDVFSEELDREGDGGSITNRSIPEARATLSSEVKG